MNKNLLLGIDIGASRLKSAVYSYGGRMLTFSSRQYSPVYPKHGWVEIEPELWWQAFCETLKDISGKIDIRLIKSIGISGTNATLGIDKDGGIVMPGIMFSDQRSIEECRYILENIGDEEILSITGNRIMPGTCSASTILWLKNKKMDEYNRIYKFIHPSTYLLYKLTGKIAVDRSRASPTLLYDINKNKWSKTLCDKLSIEITKLPDVRDAYEIIGTVSKEAQENTGLSHKTLVVTGGNDTACAALGMGIIKHYMAGDNSGTAGVLFIDVPKPVKDSRFMNMVHVYRNHYLVVAPMSSVGSSLEWFKEEFCHEEKINAHNQDKDVFTLLCELAQKSSPGANGIIFLPYLMGERAPIWDPNARGVFFGISLKTKKCDFIRAILESAAYGTRWNISIIEEKLGKEIKEIISAGGQTKSHFWLRLKSDITKKAYVIPEIAEAATHGAAILAGMGLGLNPEIEICRHKNRV
ncbi:MAG: hypothetical protein HY606_13265, partial [Planctomycetes bacterium]|nr:hypothetical protein [Planctomycetota bacterium]